MNKTELAEKLADKCDLTRARASEILDCVFSTESGNGIIAVELDAGREVVITGFGTFATKHRAARMGRNPSTGAAIQLPAKNYVTFKPGKGLKERVAK
jgi:nucleoid DNA-binding protein